MSNYAQSILDQYNTLTLNPGSIPGTKNPNQGNSNTASSSTSSFAKPSQSKNGKKSGNSSSTNVTPPHRTTLIPSELKITINQPRINRIYHELQKLNTNDFTNCCAVMFRVFIELSIDHFVQRKKISILKVPKPPKNASQNTLTPPPKEMSLREKIFEVVKFFESSQTLDKDELKGIRSLVANKDHYLSVDVLNAYVHNRIINPNSREIVLTWDNIQIFIEELWKV